MTRAPWRYSLAFGAALALGACSSEPVPELAYYALPSLTVTSARSAPVFKAPISIDSFLADGVYNEQGMLYLSQDNRNLRAYHYQLWQDPPTRMLQRRLTDTLRALRFSDLVADRLPSSSDQLQVQGLIRRFDRVQGADGWHALVQFELRVEHGTSNAPVLVKNYQADVLASDNSLQSSVLAFGAAVDKCYAEFAADLEKVRP
jgi:uncharacterized lipoprotein YmbA